MKASKAFKKQAAQAELAAVRSDDPERAKQMHDLAEAFRAQANALKAADKAKKKDKK